MEYPTPNVKTKKQFIKSIERRIKRKLFLLPSKQECKIKGESYRKRVLEYLIKRYRPDITLLKNKVINNKVKNKYNKIVEIEAKTIDYDILEFMDAILNNKLKDFINKEIINCLEDITDKECYLYYLFEIKKLTVKEAFKELKRWKDPLKKRYKELIDLEKKIPTLRYNIKSFIKNLNRLKEA